MARPKRKFSEDTEKKIAEYALVGCQTETIATLVDIPPSTLRDRFRGLLVKKRAEHKYNLRVIQNELAKTNATMAIFLGKNELGQTNEHVVNAGGQTLAALFRTADKEHKANGEGSEDRQAVA